MSGRSASRWGIIAVGLVAGCTCRTEAPPEAPPVHYDGWEALIDAARRGDVETARKLAPELDGGPLASGEEPGAAEVGAGLGFAGIAEDAEEVADGVAAAAAGCGQCHAAKGVKPYGDRPPWSHQDMARWAVWGLVWGDTSAPSDGGAIEATLAEKWAEPVDSDAPEGRERVARLLAGCQGCHGPPKP